MASWYSIQGDIEEVKKAKQQALNQEIQKMAESAQKDVSWAETGVETGFYGGACLGAVLAAATGVALPIFPAAMIGVLAFGTVGALVDIDNMKEP